MLKTGWDICFNNLCSLILHSERTVCTVVKGLKIQSISLYRNKIILTRLVQEEET